MQIFLLDLEVSTTSPLALAWEANDTRGCNNATGALQLFLSISFYKSALFAIAKEELGSLDGILFGMGQVVDYLQTLHTLLSIQI